MRKYSVFLVLLLLCLERAFSLSISPQDASIIGEKIWKNECAGTVEGLTNWKKGENFASLGIGHFIWYPAGQKEGFEETFPDLLQFFLKKEVTLPSWLKTVSGCPWTSRDRFYADIHSSKMESLRQFLLDTKSLQAIFIAGRLEAVLPQMLEGSLPSEKAKILNLFHLLAQDADGLYALIDYLNFKGSGTSSQESYKGQRWGLLQVLQRIPSSSKQPLIDFVASAKAILKERVQNSPPERNEEQWLEGWFNRLNTYLSPPKKETKT